MNTDPIKREQLLENTQGLEKYVDNYIIWCNLNNQIAHTGGFLGYVSDQQMLEKIR